MDRKQLAKEYRETNKEQIKANMHAYYIKNRDTQLERSKKYGKEHREERANYERANKEKFSIFRKINRDNNPKYKETQRKYIKSENHIKYLDRTKEDRAKRQHEWYIGNRDRILAQSRENKDKINQRNRKKYKLNPSKILCHAHKRRAKQINLDCTLTPSHWEETKKYFSESCAYCGEKKKLEQEHFIAVSIGGEYTHNNIIPCCKSCNCSKNDSDFFEWYPRQKFYSKKREQAIMSFLHYKDGIQQLALF